MKKTIMKKIVLSLFLAFPIIGQPDAAGQEPVKNKFHRFDNAIESFKKRLNIWNRCIKRECSEQEKERAIKDLKIAGKAAAVAGAVLTATLLGRHLYKKRGKIMASVFRGGISLADKTARAMTTPPEVQEALELKKLIEENKLSEFEKQLKQNPNIGNIRAGISNISPHLYMIAAEKDKPDFIDALVKHGADITKAHEYRGGDYNVVTFLVEINNFKTARALIDKHTFDWKSLADAPGYSMRRYLTMLISYAADDADNKDDAQAIFKKTQEQMGTDAFDQAINSAYNDSADNFKELLKKDLAKIGYDISKLEKN